MQHQVKLFYARRNVHVLDGSEDESVVGHIDRMRVEQEWREERLLRPTFKNDRGRALQIPRHARQREVRYVTDRERRVQVAKIELGRKDHPDLLAHC